MFEQQGCLDEARFLLQLYRKTSSVPSYRDADQRITDPARPDGRRAGGSSARRAAPAIVAITSASDSVPGGG